MKHRKLVLLMIVVFLITQLSCQFLNQMGNGGGSGYYTDPGNPLDVTIKLDASNVTQVVSTEGGEITVTGSDGTRYTLAIPAGALFAETEISMTPIASIDGLPFSGGLGGAVKLEPSGLTFFDFAILTIEPANPIPLEKQILFGFEENGEDLHLAIPGADNTKIQIRILNFSGLGVANGISADKAGVMQRMADRAEIRITNQIGEYLQNQRSGDSIDPVIMGNALTEFYNSVVAPRLKAAASASGTCADARKALQTYLAWERQRQLIDVSKDMRNDIVSDFIPLTAKKCLDEEFDRCANKHLIAGMIPAVLQVERMIQLMNIDLNVYGKWAEVQAHGASLIRKCFQWELEFESAATFTDAGGGFDSRVKANVPIRMEGELPAIQLFGKSALINVDFTFSVPECNVTNNRGGGEFIAESLSWKVVMRKDSDGENRFFIKDFFLKYSPGKTSESMIVDCPPPPNQPPMPPVTLPPTPWWTGLFVVTHYKEVDQSGGATAIDPATILEGGLPQDAKAPAYIAENWTAYEAELMATKEWQGTSDLDPAVFEGGGFKLYHRPQK